MIPSRKYNRSQLSNEIKYENVVKKKIRKTKKNKVKQNEAVTLKNHDNVILTTLRLLGNKHLLVPFIERKERANRFHSGDIQRRIENPATHLTLSFLPKKLTAGSC